MKIPALYKYPGNILIPIILFIIGMAVVFVIYKVNSVRINKPVSIESPVKMPLNTKASFNIETNVRIGEPENQQAQINFSGEGILDIDLSSGKTVLDKLTLNSKPVKVPEYNVKVISSNIALNSLYPSTGQIDLDTGNMDISLDLLTVFTYKTDNGKLKKQEANIKLPLSGNIDRNAGIIKLSGDATIPPGKENLPIPLSIQVIATTQQTPKNQKGNN